MRQPSSGYQAREFVKIASKDSAEKILVVANYINIESACDPFASSIDIKQKVCQKVMSEMQVTDIMALKLYSAAANIVVPFLASGQEYVKMNAQLDALAQKAKDHLYKKQKTFDKEGVLINEEVVFDPKVMDSIVKAIKVRSDNLTKTQGNIIKAMSSETSKGSSKNNGFEIEDAEREELERFIAGEINECPELINLLMESKEEIGEKNFHDAFDSE